MWLNADQRFQLLLACRPAQHGRQPSQQSQCVDGDSHTQQSIRQSNEKWRVDTEAPRVDARDLHQKN